MSALTPCMKCVYAYSSARPLELKGSCQFSVCVPRTNVTKHAEFFIVPGDATTLLGHELESLGVLKVGLQVNSCDANIRNAQPKKATCKAKCPKVFEGLGKLKGFQLKLYIDQTVKSVAQTLYRILFSCKQKVAEIKKVEGPTSWINPLVTVDKLNGDVCISLDMLQANQAIL